MIEKFKKLMNTKVELNFGLIIGVFLTFGSFLSLGILILAKFYLDVLLTDFIWKLFEFFVYLLLGIWLINLYFPYKDKEETIEVFDVPSNYSKK